jgi:hypothetical protein
MTPGSKAAQSKQGETRRLLSEQGLTEVMDLLRLADKSPNPEIRAAAIQIAKDESKHLRRQGSRVNPNFVLTLDVGLGIATVWFCCFAFTHYGALLAFFLILIALLLFAVVVAVSLFVSGHLSQSNFMTVFGWLGSHIKTGWNAVVKRIFGGQSQSEHTGDDSIEPKD